MAKGNKSNRKKGPLICQSPCRSERVNQKMDNRDKDTIDRENL